MPASGQRSGGTGGVKGSPIKVTNTPTRGGGVPTGTRAANVKAVRTSFNPGTPPSAKNRPVVAATPKTRQPMGKPAGPRETERPGKR